MTPFPSHCSLASVIFISLRRVSRMVLFSCWIHVICKHCAWWHFGEQEGRGGGGHFHFPHGPTPPGVTETLFGTFRCEELEPALPGLLTAWFREGSLLASLFSSICPLSTHSGHHMRYYLDLDMLLGNKEEGPYDLLDNHLE